MSKTIFGSIQNAVINGRVYKNISGRNITIERGQIIVDGKPIEDWNDSNEKEINITIEGNVDCLQVQCAGAITVNGDTKSVKTGSGDVTVTGCVKGNIHTGSGDVRCGNVEEDINTGSGDVHCGNVGGRVTTMSGDIYKR